MILLLYVRRFPDVAAGRWPISAGNGDDPVWGPDGELFYTGTAGTITTDPTFQASVPRQLFSGPYTEGGGVQYDAKRDGQHFLMLRRGASDSNETLGDQRFVSGQLARGQIDERYRQIHFVFNWFEELKEKVPIP